VFIRGSIFWGCILWGSIFCGCAFASDQSAPPTPTFKPQTIDEKIQIGYGITTADVDGDGKLDVLLADKKQFAWYRNPTWQKFIIAENLTPRDNVCLAAEDLDGDGKCELAVGADWDPGDRQHSGAVFYMVAPPDRTQKWEPIKLHAEPTVHRMRWLTLPDKGHGLIVAPLHGRGADGKAGSRILLYRYPADVRGKWQTTLLDDSMHLTHGMEVTPEHQVRIAGREGVLDILLKDAKPTLAKSWLVQPDIGYPFKGAGEFRSVDFGTFATVEPMHGNQLVVHKADSARHVLSERLIEGHALAVGHVLGSASRHAGLAAGEIVVGWRGGGGGIHLFVPLDGTYARWRESAVADSGIACEDLCLADLDDDGRLDVIASGRATHNVVIYWNHVGKD
jgi:hypothetical protein